MDWLGVVSLAIAACGSVHALAAIVVVRGFGRMRRALPRQPPSVTVLKPLHGAEPALRENLTTFCRQHYAAPLQILFGVQDADDPAVAVVEALIDEHPELDLGFVVTAASAGANPKVANLTGLRPHIRHDVVIISDSDISVSSDYVERTIAELDAPNVGLVTCLYHGIAADSLPARLASMAIDYQFLPNVLVGLALGLARPCFGSTIALRRETLAAIGGFDAFREQLADDYAIGEAVRGIGLDVAIAPFVVEHHCTERTVAELMRHEVRWARTVRAVSPSGYVGLLATYPLPFAVIGASASGSLSVGMLTIAAALVARLALQIQVDHTLGVRHERAWLGPIRDLLAFVVHVIGFFVDVVRWRGKRFRVRPDGTLIPLRESAL